MSSGQCGVDGVVVEGSPIVVRVVIDSVVLSPGFSVDEYELDSGDVVTDGELDV